MYRVGAVMQAVRLGLRRPREFHSDLLFIAQEFPRQSTGYIRISGSELSSLDHERANFFARKASRLGEF